MFHTPDRVAIKHRLGHDRPLPGRVRYRSSDAQSWWNNDALVYARFWHKQILIQYRVANGYLTPHSLLPSSARREQCGGLARAISYIYRRFLNVSALHTTP